MVEIGSASFGSEILHSLNVLSNYEKYHADKS